MKTDTINIKCEFEYVVNVAKETVKRMDSRMQRDDFVVGKS